MLIRSKISWSGQILLSNLSRISWCQKVRIVPKALGPAMNSNLFSMFLCKSSTNCKWSGIVGISENSAIFLIVSKNESVLFWVNRQSFNTIGRFDNLFAVSKSLYRLTISLIVVVQSLFFKLLASETSIPINYLANLELFSIDSV